MNLSTMQYMFLMCGSLNEIDHHKLIGSGTFRKYDFVGVCMFLLEEAYHSGGRL